MFSNAPTELPTPPVAVPWSKDFQAECICKVRNEDAFWASGSRRFQKLREKFASPFRSFMIAIYTTITKQNAVVKRAGVQIRDCCGGVCVTGGISPCILIFGDRYIWDFTFTSRLSFVFLSVRFYQLHFVSLSLTSFPLFPFTFKRPLCFCLIVYMIFFNFISSSFVFSVSFFLGLSWSFIFCVLVMTLVSGNSKLAILSYFLSIPHKPLSVLINALRHFLQPSIYSID